MSYITDYPILARAMRAMTDSAGPRFKDDAHIERTIQTVLEDGINDATGAALSRTENRIGQCDPKYAAFPEDTDEFIREYGEEANSVLETIYEQA